MPSGAKSRDVGSVSYGASVEDGIHLPGTESSEIRKRVAARFNKTWMLHDGGLRDTENSGKGRDG